MHKNYQANVQKNRNALTSIVDTIKICSRQNLPLRGHRDSVKRKGTALVGISGLKNSGNFVELSYYHCRVCDTNLKHESTAQSARCTSPETQNVLIGCCGELIIGKCTSFQRK